MMTARHFECNLKCIYCNVLFDDSSVWIILVFIKNWFAIIFGGLAVKIFDYKI